MLKICTEELCRFQAGRRSNVTGGRGGAEKILGGIQIKFSLKFWSEDQKKSSFQIAPSGYGPFASFRGTIMAWRGATGPYGTELGFCQQIQDEDQKKVFGAKSLALCWRSLVFFVLKRDFTHTWEAHAVFWGGTGAEMHSRGTRPVTFFWDTILTWGHNSRLGGSSSDLRGARPRITPRGVGPGKFKLGFY